MTFAGVAAPILADICPRVRVPICPAATTAFSRRLPGDKLSLEVVRHRRYYGRSRLRVNDDDGRVMR